MKTLLVLGIIFILAAGCVSTFNRTGFKTFMVTGYAGKEGKAEEYLDRDASKLCGGKYLVLGGKIIHHPKVFHDDTEHWEYIYEVECLGPVDERFYELNKEQQPIYIFY